MFLLGLIAAICYVPGYTGASIPTQWPILSLLLLPSLWKRGPFTSIHWLGLLFVAYALLSTLWAHNIGTSILGLWYISLWALAFWFGTTKLDLLGLWLGLAFGVNIACIIAIWQALGRTPIEVFPDQTAGLYYNSTVLGSVCALVLVACIIRRIYAFIPLLLVGLYLSHSRGAIFVAAVGLAAHFNRFLAIALAIFGFTLISHLTDNSDLQRMEIWGVGLRHLSLFGWGPDSFNDLFAILPRRPFMTPSLYHLEYAHNDYLQLWFEFGIGSLAPITLLALALTRSGPDSAILWSFATLALFYFPLYTPLTAFIGCACTGRLLRGYDPLQHLRDRWGPALLSRHTSPRSIPAQPWRQGLPLVSAHSHPEA